MKKIDKKDTLCCLTLVFSFLLFFFLITRFTYIYGSTLDWESQHSIIPDYFRTLFYDTHDLFPDFSFNLGNGQNIYNFSYYGLLSPFILLSYLLPFLDMGTYLSIASVIVAISSSLIFYFWERWNNKKSHLISFLLSFILLFSSSLTLHSHRHLMFVYYMPFLMLGLFGVDKKLTQNKGWLLSLSVFLIIMTSYYYSISGIIALTIYGIYKFISINEKFSFKKFLIEGSKFALSIVIGILMAAIIILPTFHIIFNSRGKTFNTITLKDLLIPGVNIHYVLYESYGMGLTAILILAIINSIWNKKEERFLGVFLSILILFPVVNYILNATMYIDGKILIPMMPLALISIGSLLESLFKDKLNLKGIAVPLIIIVILAVLKDEYGLLFLVDSLIVLVSFIVYKKFPKKILVVIPILIIPFAISFIRSYEDPLVNFKNKSENDNAQREAIEWITDNDDGVYRISNERTILRDVNNLYGNIDYYTSTLYSSTYNLGYNRFYYDTINNPIQNRNRVITSPTSNVLYLLFSGNRYVITNKNEYLGYDLVKTIGKNKIYKNENALPIAYATKNVTSENEFASLKYPKSSIVLLKSVVANSPSTTSIATDLKPIDIDLDDLTLKNATLEISDGHYKLKASNNASGSLPLGEYLKNKILFIRFHVGESAPCKYGDTGITISGIENKLTCKEWKYHNQNYDFDYIIAKKDLEDLTFDFKKGNYDITDIEVYVLDYEEIENLKDDIDEFKFDKDKTKGDKIEGTIDVREEGYFVTSIPYDKGFSIYIDGKEAAYEKVNDAFLGFKITKGHHDIKIEYKAPLKQTALYLSLMGLIILVIVSIIENYKK